MSSPGFGEIAEQLRRSTVQVIQSGSGERGRGSDVIWDSDGLIITNAHVAREDRADIELWDGRRLDATVIAKDVRRDIASLRVAAAGLPGAMAGDSGTLRAGELVMAIGNPLGFIGALTTGVVHGFGPLRGLGRQNWVQAAIRLAPGNSGGPLADAKGRVVGINTMVVSGGVVSGGLGLAVPSNAIEDFLKRGATSRSLGVVVRPVPLERGRAVGLLVLEVSPHGPAASASLMIGDLLTGVNGKPFKSVDDLADALDSTASPAISLRFRRGDRRVQREVTARLASESAAA